MQFILNVRKSFTKKLLLIILLLSFFTNSFALANVDINERFTLDDYLAIDNPTIDDLAKYVHNEAYQLFIDDAVLLNAGLASMNSIKSNVVLTSVNETTNVISVYIATNLVRYGIANKMLDNGQMWNYVKQFASFIDFYYQVATLLFFDSDPCLEVYLCSDLGDVESACELHFSFDSDSGLMYVAPEIAAFYYFLDTYNKSTYQHDIYVVDLITGDTSLVPIS